MPGTRTSLPLLLLLATAAGSCEDPGATDAGAVVDGLVSDGAADATPADATPADAVVADAEAADAGHPGACKKGALAPADYTHSVWGPTALLTRPPSLGKDAFVITDLERSPDNPKGPARPASGFSYKAPGGQTITGQWKPVTPMTGFTTAPGNKVWRVVIDGNGGQVWIDGNRAADGTPQNLDFGLQIRECSTLRISALEAKIADIRTVNGYHPDGGKGVNSTTRVIGISNLPGGAKVFIEGCNLAINGGGAVPMYRTDAGASGSLGAVDKPVERFVIQSSRITGVSNPAFSGTPATGGESTHCDAWHFHEQCYLRYFVVENFHGETAFQFFQMNYATNMLANKTPTKQNTLHCFYRRMSIVGQPSSARLLYLGVQVVSAGKPIPSVTFHDVTLAKVPGGWPFSPTSMFANKARPKPTWATAYLDMRSKITLHNGAVQPRMANVNAKDVVDGLQVVDTGTAVTDWAPAAAVGHAFAHLWSKDGLLLCEAK